jgi:hypothetical protein
MDSKADGFQVLEVWVRMDYFHAKVKSIQQLFRRLTNGNQRINGMPNYLFYKKHITCLQYRFEVIMDHIVFYLVASCTRMTEFKSRLKKIIYCQIDFAPRNEVELFNSNLSNSIYKIIK